MRHTHASAVVLLTGLLLSFAAASQLLDRQSRPAKPDGAGNRLYIVNLDLDTVERQDPAAEAPARAPMDPRNATDFRGWHKPKVRKLVSLLELEYGIVATTITSHALPSFSAYIPEPILERIRLDPRVERVILVHEADTLSQVPPWADQIESGETIPYGKIAVGTNDGMTTGNVTYMIDAGHPIPHQDIVNIDPAPINQQFNARLFHAFHVAGVLSAKVNNGMVRGINPSAQIISVNIAIADAITGASVRQALDWVLGDAEWKEIHAVANVSANGDIFANGHTDQVANFMRRLSNRVLIVQSAGNGLVDACGVAYGPASPRDGLLVVSAVDEAGRQPVPFANGGGPGANWGNCVEMWAPGQRVVSTSNGTDTAVLTPSGTSFSAPYVAALAARYGSTSTTAVQRENYVRARLRATGWLDDHNFTITVPSYLQTPAFLVAPKLGIAAASADASLSGNPPSAAIDGNYLSTSWNAGHSAPGWIELDLGASYNLDSLRLSPSQTPAGSVTHHVYVGNTPNPITLVENLSGTGGDLEPFVVNAATHYARYLRIHTASSPSWVAWRELEVYGFRTDDLTIGWFYLGLLNRIGADAELAYYLGQLRAARCGNPNWVHGTLDSISYGFLNSAEFLALGLSNSDYVTALYRGVLRRPPDAGGLAYWEGQLVSGATRENVRLGFVYSTEFFNNTVSRVMSEPCI